MTSRSKLSQAYFNLATMLDAGLPLLRSLNVATENSRGQLKRVFARIRESISQGSSFAEAMDEHRRVFPDLDRELIAAAETSGALNRSLTMLAEWHDFMYKISRRILVGLLFPFIILHVGVFLASVPVFVFSGFDPSQLIRSVLFGLGLFYVPAAVIVGCILMRDKIPPLRLILDTLVLRIPIFGKAVYHMSVCRYAKAFGMMYGAGVPILETIERANKAAGNAVVERLFAGGLTSVRAGGMAWQGFSKRLPSEYTQLWQIGEESGELDKTVGKIADISGDRADLLFTEFARWMPIFVYACVAAFLIVQIFRGWQMIYGNMLRQIPM